MNSRRDVARRVSTAVIQPHNFVLPLRKIQEDGRKGDKRAQRKNIFNNHTTAAPSFFTGCGGFFVQPTMPRRTESITPIKKITLKS